MNDLAAYRQLCSFARHAFGALVVALNRRDTLAGELTRSRHPLPDARMEYLTAESIAAHKRCEHLERELDDYDAQIKRLARLLGLDDEDDERGDGARSAGLRRTGDVGPATRATRGSAADAPQQQSLFA